MIKTSGFINLYELETPCFLYFTVQIFVYRCPGIISITSLDFLLPLYLLGFSIASMPPWIFYCLFWRLAHPAL